MAAAAFFHYGGPNVLEIGPFSLPVFGMLVATGILVGHAVVLRLAAEKRVPVPEIRAAAAWAVGAGFFGAHAFDVLLYHPEKFARDGVLAFFKVWDGISSFGGFFGALAGVSLYFAMLRKRWWVHADLLIQGLVVGWVFGRFACTLLGDHPGHLTQFPLAFEYPGGARHNLGFYEFLYTAFVLVPAVLVLRRREQARGRIDGLYVAVVCALYAPARFLMDFLRAADIPGADTRYGGLTVAQLASIAIFVLALVLLRRLRRAKPAPQGRG